jgi:hypothetical protein
MGDMVWVQCARCGHLHRVKEKDASLSDDDLYITELFCFRCRDGTKHLLIGEDKYDVYLYGDTTLDERFYNYNTK